ncbi:MAG: DUF3833 family protein [Pseudomonadota bacterium]
MKRQFVVDLDGRPDGDAFVLTEDFRYDDGETEQRIWRIKKLDEHRYEGRAAGVVGTAAGLAYGSALNWQYDFDLKIGDSTLRVAFDDWMFQQDAEVMVNRAPHLQARRSTSARSASSSASCRSLAAGLKILAHGSAAGDPASTSAIT